MNDKIVLADTTFFREMALYNPAYAHLRGAKAADEEQMHDTAGPVRSEGKTQDGELSGRAYFQSRAHDQLGNPVHSRAGSGQADLLQVLEESSSAPSRETFSGVGNRFDSSRNGKSSRPGGAKGNTIKDVEETNGSRVMNAELLGGIGPQRRMTFNGSRSLYGSMLPDIPNDKVLARSSFDRKSSPSDAEASQLSSRKGLELTGRNTELGTMSSADISGLRTKTKARKYLQARVQRKLVTVDGVASFYDRSFARNEPAGITDGKWKGHNFDRDGSSGGETGQSLDRKESSTQEFPSDGEKVLGHASSSGLSASDFQSSPENGLPVRHGSASGGSYFSCPVSSNQESSVQV